MKTLRQNDADALIAMRKRAETQKTYNFPDLGGSITVPLISTDERERFRLTVGRGYVKIEQISFQTMAHGVVVLVRVDIEGPPHRNPDNEIVPTPHMHLYREGYGDRWAVPLCLSRFSNVSCQVSTLFDFMEYCGVEELPSIQTGLF